MKHYDSNADFSFMMDVAKSFTEVEAAGPKMVIKGVASNTKKDLQGHAFTRAGLESIKQAIEEGILDEDGDRIHVPLLSGHGQEWEHVLGDITKAEIDGEDNLWITAELDEDSSRAHDLYRKITKGNSKGKKAKLGLSVKGKVTKYHFAWDDKLGERVPRFDNLLIKEVSVTQKPVNPTPYPLAISKSLISDPGYAQALEDSMTTEVDVTKNQQEDGYSAHPANQVSDTEHKNIGGSEALQNAAEAANAPLEPVSQEEADAAVAASSVDASTAPSEPQRVSDTPAQDSNANDVPDGYTVINPPESETQQEASQQEVTTAPAEAAPAQNLQSSVDSLAQMVEALRQQIEALRSPEPVEAQKAQTEEVVTEPVVTEPATPVQTEEVSLDEKIALAVTKALESTLAIKVTQEIDAVKSLINDLSEQPVDKSISVQKAKDAEDANDPHRKYSDLRQKGQDPIAAAFGAAKARQ